jgi:hypothetical protein
MSVYDVNKASRGFAMSAARSLPSALQDVKERLRAALDADGKSPPEFDLDQWLQDWLERPQPALGGARPVQLLDSAEGLESVRRTLGALLSGAYQ